MPHRIRQSSANARSARMMWQVLLIIALGFIFASAFAGPAERAKFIHDRLAGIPAADTTDSVLARMTDLVAAGDIDAAARLAMQSEAFYRATLKTMAAPWTNREQTPFADLNDYSATFIGLVRDDLDLRRLLWDDIIYVSSAPGLPAYATTDNAHYEALEAASVSLKDSLELRSQSSLTGLPAGASAGVLTSRGAARAFFIDGTNRAMLRFTLMNHLCYDLEQLEDITGVPDRIRQDVSRSPGGDSRLFNNGCVGCHTGMDPLAQAFAYYNFDYVDDPDTGSLRYTPGQVQAKYLINADNFPPGYVTTSDQWDNYWRTGPNSRLGWDTQLAGTGQGARSLGQELANSAAFAQCQVEKVFNTVCLRQPGNTSDQAAVIASLNSFISSGYRLQQAFVDTVSYCSAGLD